MATSPSKASKASPASASSRVGDTSDILSHIFSYLPKSTLFSTLQVSKTFFHSSVPHLYHTLTIKSGTKNIFSGSTRSDNLTFDKQISNSDSRTEATNEITKNSLLKYIKRIDIYVHPINECQFVKTFIEPLPNLEILHLAKGKRNNNEGGFTDLNDEKNVCYGGKCQFITKVCKNTRKVIIRDLDFTPIMGFKNLEKVVLKLRPCELPRYTGEGIRPRRGFDHMPNEEENRNYEPNLDEYTDIWFKKTKLPSSVKELDLIWWDEHHSYRIDSYEREFSGFGHWGGRGNQDKKRLMNGCNYCDQQGCVRYSPHVGIQIPVLFKILGKNNPNLNKIRVWNFQRTCDEEQWPDYTLSYEDLKDKLIESFKKGRVERKSTISQVNHDKKLDEEMEEDNISFNSGLEYLTYGQIHSEIDMEELEYWEHKFNPSNKLKELREKVWSKVNKDNFIGTREDLDTWLEESCLEFLTECEMEQNNKKQDRRINVDETINEEDENEQEEEEGEYGDFSDLESS